MRCTMYQSVLEWNMYEKCNARTHYRTACARVRIAYLNRVVVSSCHRVSLVLLKLCVCCCRCITRITTSSSICKVCAHTIIIVITKRGVDRWRYLIASSGPGICASAFCCIHHSVNPFEHENCMPGQELPYDRRTAQTCFVVVVFFRVQSDVCRVCVHKFVCMSQWVMKCLNVWMCESVYVTISVWVCVYICTQTTECPDLNALRM